MRGAAKPRIDTARIQRFLTERHGADVSDLEALRGGFWSAAWAYRVGDDAFVLRLGRSGQGFAIDAAAMRFASEELPVPAIVERGEALGLHFAISRRHRGRFLEDAVASEGDVIGATLARLLAALRTVPSTPAEPVEWYDPAGSVLSWHAWLLRSLDDDAAPTTHGWRAKLAADPHLDALFEACVARIRELLPRCPERRDLVHGDLLHQNVLVSQDGTRTTGVFSWKCSARGDFLFDVAWCSVWSPWHPGIAAADVWQRTLDASDLGPEDLHEAPARHHCYALQILAHHLGWNAWTGDAQALAEVARATEALLA